MHRVTLGVLASLLLALACGPSAAPAPGGGGGAPTGSGASAAAPSAPSGAAGSAPAPAAASPPQSDAVYRQQVIDAARAEGQVNATLHTSWTPDGIARVEDAIEHEYGVRIKVNYQPIINYVQRASELLGEAQANVTPSFDLYQSSDTTAATLFRAGAQEDVNWAPLLPQGTPAKSIGAGGRYVVVYTDHFGLLTDPTVIADADVPRSMKDLGNPKYRGKVMLFVSTNTYLPWVIRLGRDATFAALRAAVQNGAIADTFPGHLTRYAAKEYPMATTGVTFARLAEARGLPMRFTPLDFSQNTDHLAFVARRAAHPNAAKLLAAVLAGPAGAKIEEDVIGGSYRYYPGTREAKLEDDALAAGFPSFSWTDTPDALDIVLTPEGESAVREMEQIIQGG
jgi:ABC-type Fe3+ transport system substrate-binding protein